MSVLIKGAKPPSGCVWCYFNEDSRCVLIVGCDYDETNGAQRRENCPLIELPDHGDLIDRSELERVLVINKDCDKCIHRAAFCCDRDPDFVVACEAIYDAPVVIPAERSEE